MVGKALSEFKHKDNKEALKQKTRTRKILLPFVRQFPPPGGGVLLEKLGGGGPLPKTLTLFMTKISVSVYDLTKHLIAY